MPLSDDQKREIRQLMFVAFRYLDLASEAAAEKHSSVTFGSLAKSFPLEEDVEEPLREQITISADLASAAIRLTSADHVLGEAKCGRDVYTQCRKYFRMNSPLLSTDLHEHPQWFHVMLRDVVGHAEPTEGRTEEQTSRYCARAELIAGTTLGWAYSRLRLTAVQLMGFLKTRDGIVVAR